MDEMYQISRYPGKSSLIEMINEGKFPFENTEKICLLIKIMGREYNALIKIIGELPLKRRKEMYLGIKNDPIFEKFYDQYQKEVNFVLEDKTETVQMGSWFKEKKKSPDDHSSEDVIQQILKEYPIANLFITPDGMYRLGKDGKPITLEEVLCVGDYKHKEEMMGNKGVFERLKILALSYINR